MAETREQCEELLRVAELAKGEFMVGHVCRFDPRVTAAKAAIEAGRIGRVVSMHAKRNLPKAPGNIRLDKISPLMGDGIHDADMMMWFLAESPTENLRKECAIRRLRVSGPRLGNVELWR
jgi:predicted dehydrogenase